MRFSIHPFICSLLFTFLLFSTSVVKAESTPDGETPSQEEVCDVLFDSTPGLYGLCVAYCEAQDAPTELSSADVLDNLTIPNIKILANYNKRKKDTDPDMPCVSYADDSACPAWTFDELDVIWTLGYPTTLDDSSYTDGNNKHHIFDHEGNGFFIDENGMQTAAVQARVITQLNGDGDPISYVGSYSDYVYNFTLAKYTRGTTTARLTPLSAEAAAACTQEIIDNVLE